ncbi:N-formylglutamate amidohydrolase [Agaricicola taiwanensis]|uniref:N-formylglutamate amidohydrolase n=1 Tax=Agaricicola taiwanensis TaxID=591372 RepID=A0A8J2VQA0_9RHOB|nr:N-formylglutamate amidohydrolase [Agaricicola taiwanensis]GGE38599.1 N-formylglutamate amidohydrolase [Agaricicola taiwanensis]
MTETNDFPAPFDLFTPAARRAPVLFNSPHSGSIYPKSFLATSRLDPLTLRRSEDTFVDGLFVGAVEKGASFMRAHFPRAYLDVNREPYELDPRMFDGRLPPYANTRSLRVAGGLGTIARLVGENQEIYRSRLPVAAALERIENLYKPYHQALTNALIDIHQAHGAAVLIDCHSMPSNSQRRPEKFRADIVLGDRYGTSCAPELTAFVAAALTRLGYAVMHNRPYAGGYITEHYGNPAMRFHALQIEINRGLYMDEATLTRNDGFDRLAADLGQMIDELITFPFDDLLPERAAAE